MTDIDRDLTPTPHRPGPPAERPGVTDYLLAMGHELRAPLNGVIGMSGLLLDGDLTAQQRQYVRSVHAAGESLGAILNDILDLARVTTSRLIVEPIPFDLKSMIEETASVLTPRAAERGLALRVDLRPELPRHVIGDPGRTRQVLGNLVGHAVNGTSQGEIVIRVQGDGENGEHAWVRFVVEDTGIGVSAARLQRVFDEYVPVDASPYRSFGVTGLGLRLSAELVRLMGGEIGAESTPGKGSRFWFTLPLVIADPAHAHAPEAARATAGGRALIVEADPTSRSRFVEQFDAAGWDVAFVDDIDKVVNELREGAAIGNPYSACVFSHYAVRPMHAEIATRLKADSALAKVALVMITAVGSPGEGKKLWHAGFAAYLRRPVPSEEIRETLLAVELAGADGRTPTLVTRHSLAEARNAQSFVVDGIDQMLASLGTAAGTRRTLLIPIGEMTAVAELFDQRGLAADTATSLDHALNLLGEYRYECIVLDVRGRADLTRDLAAIRERLGVSGAIPIVALAEWNADQQALIEAAVDDVWTAPVSGEQLDHALARWQDVTTAPDEPVVETSAVVEAGVVEPITTEPVIEDTIIEDTIIAAPDFEEATAEVSPVEAFTDEPAAEAYFEPVAEPIADVVEPIVESVEFTVEEIVESQPVEAYAAAVEPWFTGPPLFAAPEPAPVAVVEQPVTVVGPPASAEEPAVAFAVDEAPAALDGRVDAQWELHPQISVIDGFVATEDEHMPPASDAIVEAVDLAPPSVDVIPTPAPDEDVIVESVELATLVPMNQIEAPAPVPVIELGIAPIDIALIAPVQDDLGLVGNEPPADIPADQSETVPTEAVAGTPLVEVDPALDIISPALLEQALTGGGFFTQYQIASFVREVPSRITDIATAATRGDAARVTERLSGLRRLVEAVGAARIGAVAAAMEAEVAADRLEGATARLGSIEHAFLEARQALEEASPHGLPADQPAIGNHFADQLSPAKEGAARTLAQKLAGSFAADAPKRLADLRTAVADADEDGVQRVAQTFKGMCGLIGAEWLAKLVALAEADARLKRVTQAERYLEHIDLELGRVLAALESLQA